MPAPFRKFSSISCTSESRAAYEALLGLDEEITQSDGPVPSGFKEQLVAMVTLLFKKLVWWEAPMSPKSFSIPFEDDLETKFNLKGRGYLVLKPNWEERVAAALSKFSKDDVELWSSANLYRHLQALERQVPMRTKVDARGWIEAFFFRVSAMLPKNKGIILNHEREQAILSSSYDNLLCASPISGFVDYYAVMVENIRTDESDLLMSQNTHILNTLIPHTGLFITVVSEPMKQLSQAISEIYTCGTRLRKKTIRGAVTNGRDWIFLLLNLNEDNDGGSYMSSSMFEIKIRHDSEMLCPDMIPGVLAYWTEHGFSDLEDDDYFKQSGFWAQQPWGKKLEEGDSNQKTCFAKRCYWDSERLNGRAVLLVSFVTAALIAVIALMFNKYTNLA